MVPDGLILATIDSRSWRSVGGGPRPGRALAISVAACCLRGGRGRGCGLLRVGQVEARAARRDARGRRAAPRRRHLGEGVAFSTVALPLVRRRELGLDPRARPTERAHASRRREQRAGRGVILCRRSHWIPRSSIGEDHLERPAAALADRVDRARDDAAVVLAAFQPAQQVESCAYVPCAVSAKPTGVKIVLGAFFGGGVPGHLADVRASRPCRSRACRSTAGSRPAGPRGSGGPRSSGWPRRRAPRAAP
jgi:hypothetical protein